MTILPVPYAFSSPSEFVFSIQFNIFFAIFCTIIQNRKMFWLCFKNMHQRKVVIPFWGMNCNLKLLIIAFNFPHIVKTMTLTFSFDRKAKHLIFFSLAFQARTFFCVRRLVRRHIKYIYSSIWICGCAFECLCVWHLLLEALLSPRNHTSFSSCWQRCELSCY